MAIFVSKIEFDLSIKKYQDKNNHYPYGDRVEKGPEYEVTEELSFKSLSAVEVLRKLLDYLQ